MLLAPKGKLNHSSSGFKQICLELDIRLQCTAMPGIFITNVKYVHFSDFIDVPKFSSLSTLVTFNLMLKAKFSSFFLAYPLCFMPLVISKFAPPIMLILL